MDISSAFGAALVGGLGSAVLYGIATLQGRSIQNVQACNPVHLFVIAKISPSDKIMIDTMCTSSPRVWHGGNSYDVLQPIQPFSLRFYTVTPTVSTLVLTEVLITVSLCILFESGSPAAFPRTKRLLNTLIIYAVNRCLLTLLVAIAELTVDADDRPGWTMGLGFIMGKLYANSLVASLNTRQHLRSQGSNAEPDVRVSSLRFANPPKLWEGERSSKDARERNFVVSNGPVIDITAAPLHRTIAWQREGEV